MGRPGEVSEKEGSNRCILVAWYLSLCVQFTTSGSIAEIILAGGSERPSVRLRPIHPLPKIAVSGSSMRAARKETFV